MTEIAQTAQQASGSTALRSGPAMTAALPAVMRQPEPPLSDLHGMLAQIERHHEAHFINRVVNDPSVYPWVKGWATGPLDVSPVLENPRNVLLMGELGGILFVWLQAGLYEAHTSILPSRRGAWALSAVKAMLHWMFTRTDAVEIVTRCPKGNLPARALATAIGGRFLFTNPRGWVKDLDPVPADIFSLVIQDWMRPARRAWSPLRAS